MEGLAERFDTRLGEPEVIIPDFVGMQASDRNGDLFLKVIFPIWCEYQLVGDCTGLCSWNGVHTWEGSFPLGSKLTIFPIFDDSDQKVKAVITHGENGITGGVTSFN